MRVYNDIRELIGNTPMLRLHAFETKPDVKLYAKLELWNPAGSVKDRIGVYMLEDAERRGELRPGATIIEATAGNTGLGFALAALGKGYRVIFVVPTKFSQEKLLLMRALGGEIIHTPREKGMLGAAEKAEELLQTIENSISLRQFENLANPMAHYLSTGKEIYEDMDGQIDYFVAGAGTGGTYTGIMRYLKEQNPRIRGILADPIGSTMGGGEHADYNIEGIGNEEKVRRIRARAIKAGLKLVDCPIRHMGTEKAHDVYLGIEHYLMDHGVEMYFDTECRDLIMEGDVCRGVYLTDGKKDFEIRAEHTVVATGRRGADWLEKICSEHGVEHQPSTVDIGVRVEVRNEIMEEINDVLYESKLIGYPKPFKNKVRTFCQNPGGVVSQENYDNDLAVVNGHAFKGADLKSPNTNVAILCSHNFSVPFNQPIAYAQKVGELTNMLANGHILVQRFGDILDGKRTWEKELAYSNVRPTLVDAVAGDITDAMPYRAMINIINFIKSMDEVVPGFASYETLLYSPELKFYSNKVKMDTSFNTNVPGLHALGDSSGWTRGLMMASAMGVLMGRELA